MSITRRILLAFILISAAGWLFLLEPVIKRVERQYLEAAEEPMVETAEILAAIVSQSLERDGTLPAGLAEAFNQIRFRELKARIYSLLKTRVEMEVSITDAQGIVLFDSRGAQHVGEDHSRFLDVSRTLLGRYGARSSRVNEPDESSSVMHVGAPILVKGEIAGVLSVAKPQKSMLTFISETREILRAIALVGIAGFLAVGLLLSRWVTHPMRVLTRHAVAVADGNRPEAPSMPGRHLSVLGNSIERMRNALEDRNYVESYVQTLTHEMKGPVAAIRGAAEILEGDPPAERRKLFAGNIQSESNRLQQLIDRMLSLAALENRKRLETPKRLDLTTLVSRVVNECQSHYSSSGCSFTFNTNSSAWVQGEEFLLETAVRNLVSNAAEFSPNHKGQVTVSVEHHADQILLSVRDNGPGIPEYALERVFQHFYSLPRPATGRKSSGLGLCFVKECIQLHGGHVSLTNHQEGGAEAILTLPSAIE